MGVCNASFFIFTFLQLCNSILRMSDVQKNVSQAPGRKKLKRKEEKKIDWKIHKTERKHAIKFN